jgi:ASC-1-like (ASCH) protein
MVNSLSKELIGFKNYSKNEIINIYKEIYPNDKEEKEFGIVFYKISII